MEANPGGNEAFNSFLKNRGIPKGTDIPLKYNSNAASNFSDKIQTVSENKHRIEPPIVKEYGLGILSSAASSVVQSAANAVSKNP
ncbi:hypothetical protein RJ641_036367 [Dillenia turbinata]|uniref:Uncharacterized protein n=1 Tax=Dillenia turbinata TaxID=194707 RepID=A0AAN8VEA4_9MAGN